MPFEEFEHSSPSLPMWDTYRQERPDDCLPSRHGEFARRCREKAAEASLQRRKRRSFRIVARACPHDQFLILGRERNLSKGLVPFNLV